MISMNQINKNNNKFETTFLALAATLVTLEIPLESLIKNPDSKATFIFKNTEEVQSIINNFWNRSLKVEPYSFFEVQKFLKSRVYEDLKNA